MTGTDAFGRKSRKVAMRSLALVLVSMMCAGQVFAQASVLGPAGHEPCHPGPMRDAFHAGLRRKLQEDGNCWAGGPTSNLVNRMSDAGYYYCQQRSQRTASTPQQGLAMFE